jgi:thiamine pyrophosphokinase
VETAKPLTAFIFANGDANDGPLVRQTLDEQPDAWVIAADGGARQARYFGRTVQTLIGDLDSIEPDEAQALIAAGAELLQSPVEKDETDLELALLLAAQRGAARIRIFSALGDRLDQTLANVYLLALPALAGRDVRIVAGKQEAWLLRPGKHTLAGAPGDTVSLIPLTGVVQGVRTERLYYPLRDETLRFGPARGISNVMQAESAQVEIGEGTLLAVHTLGRA